MRTFAYYWNTVAINTGYGPMVAASMDGKCYDDEAHEDLRQAYRTLARIFYGGR
jgi:hypothetical protein